jgi:regulator of replication initiation timing
MKGKILTALKTKYRTLGFGDKAFDGVADYLSKTVTEESQIETATGGVESLLKAFQGDIDKIRGENTTLKAENEKLKAKPEEKADGTDGKKADGADGEKPDGTDEKPPKWAQALIASNVELAGKLAEYEKKTAEEKRTGEILAKAKEHGIPDRIITRYRIADDANLDDYMKEVKQELADLGFQGVKSPEKGGDPKTEGENIAALINKGTKEIVENKK